MPDGARDAKVLITGASGMLGLALTKRFAGRYEVVGVSQSGRGNTVACDLSEAGAVRRLFDDVKPSLVVHAAAFSSVDGCEKDPGLAHKANALSTKHLAELCGASAAPFVYISTDYVFDGRKRSPYVESDRTGPVNIYGMTKLEGEYYAMQCAAPSAVLRTSWLFGPGNPDSFVNAILTRLKTSRQVHVLEDQVDAPTSVEDLAFAILDVCGWLLLDKKSGRVAHEIFHLCNQGQTTRFEMTQKIKEYLRLSDVRVDVAAKEQIAGRLALRPPYAVMSSKRYEQRAGRSMRPWQEALKDYVTSVP